MAATHQWKVYTAEKEYIASVKSPFYGAMILAGLGQDGATLRRGHRAIVWTEGVDGEAAESYDAVERTVLKKSEGIRNFQASTQGYHAE